MVVDALLTRFPVRVFLSKRDSGPLCVLNQAVSGGVGGGRHELVSAVRPQASALLRDASSEGRDRSAHRGLHPQPPGLELRPHRRGDGSEGVSQT